MHQPAAYHKVATWLRSSGKGIWSCCVVLLCWSSVVMGQEITISDAVISIPEGVSLSTGGGITLSDAGMIDLDGQISLSGDWTDDGKGLSTQSRGEVVFEGKQQRIGGRHVTQFHDLRVASGKALELKCNIGVTGDLVLFSGIVYTHFHEINLLGEARLIDAGAVCRIRMEHDASIAAAALEIHAAGNGHPFQWGHAGANAGGVVAPQVRARGGKQAAKDGASHVIASQVHASQLACNCNRATVAVGTSATAAIVTMQAHAAGLSDGEGISEADFRATVEAAFVVCGPLGRASTTQTRKQDSNPAFASSFFKVEFSRIRSC